MLKLIKVGLVAVVMAMGAASAWAGPHEDFIKGYEYATAGNYSEAVKWYRKSSDQGHSGAQYNLGNLYAEGQGVLRDDVMAVLLYSLAARQGLSFAQGNLGAMYYGGLAPIIHDVG